MGKSSPNAATERKWDILRSVVTEYIETAQPVGSAHLAKTASVGVSSATVRHDMAVLEEEGYLVQPHTSAGRVPTDKGYRFFVDELQSDASKNGLIPGQNEEVSKFFANARGELEAMLQDTSQLLSRLTKYASVVVAPVHESAVVRSSQLVALGQGVAMLVVVLADGAVLKTTLECDPEVVDGDLALASERICAGMIGRSLKDAASFLAESHLHSSGSEPRLADLGATIVGAVTKLAGSAFSDQQIYVGGTSRMAEAFDAIETVRSVLQTLEKQYVVVTLLKEILGSGVSVAIGTEHGNVNLAECSLVVAPYRMGGQEVGTIGVLGPTRMHYPQAMAAVAVVGHRLGSRLSEG